MALNASADEAADTARQLREVVIVAQEARGAASSSTISRTAMQHLQPTSFADLLELLPGNVSHDPAMGSVATIALRETGPLSATGSPSTNDQYAIASLGTQFVVDGSPISTDADMQSISALGAFDASGRRSSTNRGVDMRTISTDNIESVEIVRGIPSAEYGNLTSGLVNIRRIKRSTPFTLRFKADQYSKLVAATKGYALGATRHTINIDLSYLDSKVDPRNSLENYRRITALVLPTWRFDSRTMGVNWSVGLDYTASVDDAKLDPDLNFNKIDEFHSSYNRFALTSDLSMTLYSCSWLDNIVVNASASYQRDELTRRKQVSPQRAAVAPSGMDEGDHFVSLLLGEYVAEHRVDGRPFAANIKLKANGRATVGELTNMYKLGTEWNFTKNYGRGQLYDLAHPIAAGWTERPRAFADVPSMQVLSCFAEDEIKLIVGSNTLDAQIGLRAMCMPGLDRSYSLSRRVHLDPRVNLQWQFPVIDARRPLRLSVGAGWGRNTKLPTLDYLFPQNHYVDVVQLSYYDAVRPAECSAVNVRTYRVDAVNYGLRAATNAKWELRFGASWGNNRLSVTYFEERMRNGFRYTPVYRSYAYRSYDASAYDPAVPTLDGLPYRDAAVLNDYSTPTNGTRIDKRGIEYTLQTERFAPLRTSLIINGAWFRSTYSNSQALYSPVTDVIGHQAVSDLYVGIYDTNDGRVNEQLNTNFMFDTQLPQWGLIFTTTVQCMWYVTTTRLRDAEVPTSYISAADGQIHPYDRAAAADPILRYLTRHYNDNLYRTVRIPTAIYLNLKVSKQIGRSLRLSAFVNRIIDYLPDYKSNGLTVRRSSDAYFGMETIITI